MHRALQSTRGGTLSVMVEAGNCQQESVQKMKKIRKSKIY